MSAFAVVFNRSNAPSEVGVFDRVMERLSHHGPDGSDIASYGNVTMGHWHFWTTPEEIGEHQPLALTGTPFKIVLDGRIDNRKELFFELNISPDEGRSKSDAALILSAYEKWGRQCFAKFIGEFALVIYDEEKNSLVCARDAMGDRTLFHSSNGSRVVIASEPWAVAAADGAVAEVDESAVANYFALKVNQNGQTLFKNIYELLPARAMIVDQQRQSILRYWQPDPAVMLRGRSDEEYGERFLSLLEESVRCRMRSTTAIGVQMSGGLDSTSIASLAARLTPSQKITTISYIFDEFQECDEREFITAMVKRWNIRSIQILCDDAWPFKGWEKWNRNPNQPELHTYRLLAERVYTRAHDEGLRVLMTGTYGDHLYNAGSDWIADLILDWRLRDAMQELILQIRNEGTRRAYSMNHPRRLARRVLDTMQPGQMRPNHKKVLPIWLNSSCANLLSEYAHDVNRVFDRHGYLLNMGPSGGVSRETRNASCHQIELRHPYRDRRLIEYVLALPAYQLYRRGVYKHVLRTAMKGILPEIIRVRSIPTSLITFYSHGVAREKEVLRNYFRDVNAIWRKYVRADWLLERWEIPLTPEKDGPEAIVAWLCASFERWSRSPALSF